MVEHLSSSNVVSGICVTQSLVRSVVFCRSCFVVSSFRFIWITLSDFLFDIFNGGCLLRTWRVLYKKQELLPLGEQMGSPSSLWLGPCCSSFWFSTLCCFVCLRSESFARCFLCLWIVYSWLLPSGFSNVYLSSPYYWATFSILGWIVCIISISLLYKCTWLLYIQAYITWTYPYIYIYNNYVYTKASTRDLIIIKVNQDMKVIAKHIDKM